MGKASFIVLTLGVVGAMVCFEGQWAAAQGDAAGVQRLFDVGWPKTARARDDARVLYDRLKAQAPRDARIDLAYALVQLRQQRYPDAVKAVDAALALDRKNIAAWKIKVWLSALTKEYGAAISDMQRLADLVPAEPPTGPEVESLRDTAAFLGRICGFLEGPAHDAVSDADLARCRQRLQEKLTGDLRTAFNDGRKTVITQFAGGTEEIEQTTAAAEAEAARQKEKAIEEARKRIEGAEATLREADSRLQRAKAEYDAAIGKIAASEAELASRFGRVESERARARADLAVNDGRIVQFADLADREPDPIARANYLASLSFYQGERTRIAAALVGLDRQYSSLVAERNVLQQRRATEQAKLAREAAPAEAARQAISRARTDLAKTQGEKVTGVTPSVRDHKRRVVALTSYVPLPVSLESQRDELIRSFE